ncbi:unnamed protein product [Taenia asiatica]|uniref:TPR_REGION domain-containing protein n=1 Tax=Taenia asiatica TaxID=60517 RepID=A0A0R3VV26_TAEAS|nr:unnamed protein product [Taenia asiatica]
MHFFRIATVCHEQCSSGYKFLEIWVLSVFFDTFTELHSPENKTSPAPEETPLEAAIGLKDRGNRLFKAGRYAKAVECYTEALEQCPPNEVRQRATFFQNRAAARENLRQLEAAVEDCNAALELSPTYVKALNRRARLYERLNDLPRSLSDVTACCLLEGFKNSVSVATTHYVMSVGGFPKRVLLPSVKHHCASLFIHTYFLLAKDPTKRDNVLCMDRVLKEIGQKLAREEPPKLPRTLPSSDFIKFYFSSWAHNPFTLEAMKIKRRSSADAERTTNGPTETVKEEGKEGEAKKEEKRKEDGEKDEAEEGKEERKEGGEKDKEKEGEEERKEDSEKDTEEEGEEKKEERKDDGEGERKEVNEQQPVEAEEVFKLPKKLASAYTHLEEAFKKLQISEYEESWNLVATAVKLFNSASNVDLRAFERSAFGDREKPESARARALLLEATFMALSGDVEEAKARFLSIGEALFAHPTIRVNALIKAGALYMTIDKDISGCMYCFQQAQTLNPLCPDVYLHRGQINLLAENLEAAEKDLCEAVRLRPDFSVAQACVPAQWLYLLYRKSDKDGKSVKIEEHLKEFQKLIEKWPDCVETHSLYAQVTPTHGIWRPVFTEILTERGEFQKSDDEFARIIELSPNSGLAYSHRGLLQLRWKQDQDAADNWFRRAVEVDPRCELAWELRGQLAMERGELEKAEKYFQRALDEARTSQDRSHLFALREGVKAQIHAAEVYGISIASLFAEIRNDFQRRIAAGGDGIPVPV